MTKEPKAGTWIFIDDDEFPPDVIQKLKHGEEPFRTLNLLVYWWNLAHPGESPKINGSKDLMDVLLEEDVDHHFHRHTDHEDLARDDWPL